MLEGGSRYYLKQFLDKQALEVGDLKRMVPYKKLLIEWCFVPKELSVPLATNQECRMARHRQRGRVRGEEWTCQGLQGMKELDKKPSEALCEMNNLCKTRS